MLLVGEYRIKKGTCLGNRSLYTTTS